MSGKFVFFLALLLIVGTAFVLSFDVWILTSGIAFVGSALIPTNRSTKPRLTAKWWWRSKPIPLERGVTDNHGHASEMGDPEAMSKFPPRPHPEYGGKVIGRLCSNGKTLYDHMNTGHTALTVEFSGSGTGKTSSLMTMACRFSGPRIINDPSGEIVSMLWRRMVDYEGEENFHIVSPDPEPKDQYGQPEPWAHLVRRYNPVGWIDPSKPLAMTAVRTVVRSFFAEETEESKGSDNAYFRKAARSMIAAVLGDILWQGHGEPEPESEPESAPVLVGSDEIWMSPELRRELEAQTRRKSRKPKPPPPIPKNLVAMREILSFSPDLLERHLRRIQVQSPCPMARRVIGPLFNSLKESGKTFSNVWDEANQATMWLTDSDLASMVSGSDFRAADICDPTPKTIIFNLPLDLQQTDPEVGRVLFGSLVSAKIASKTTNWALFLPDEPWVFGRAKWIETAIGAGRKHGVAMHAPWLDVGTLERVWDGKNGRSFWFSNARAIIISRLNDPSVAREIADACGTYGVLARSEGTNRGTQAGAGFWRGSRGSNVSIHEIKRPVRMLHELIQDMERDDLLVLGIGRPLPLKRAVWMDYPDLVDEIEPSPYDRRVA